MRRKQRLQFETLENRSLLAVSPIGGDIVIAENPVGSEQPRLDSLAILPDGGAFAVANSNVPAPLVGTINNVNEPAVSFTDLSLVNSTLRVDASPSGSLTAAYRNSVPQLVVDTCQATNPSACDGQGFSISDAPQTLGWSGPISYDLASRDSGAFVVYEQAWNGPREISPVGHRLQGVFVGPNGIPQSAKPFVIPGSEAGYVESYEGPSIAVSNANAASVVLWREAGIPFFSLRNSSGSWPRRGESAYGQVVDIDFVSHAAVAMADDGSFATTWVEHSSTVQLGQPTIREEVLAIQLYNANGVRGRKIKFDSGNDWSNTDIDMRGDGSFVVVAVEEGSGNIVYFSFNAGGDLQPYHTGDISAVYSSDGTIFVNPNSLPSVNEGRDGYRLRPKVQTNGDSFRVAWTQRQVDVNAPWRIETRLFAESNDDVAGRVARSNRIWLGSLDYSDPTDQSSMNLIRLPGFPANHQWSDVLVGDFDGDGNDEGMARSLSTGEWWINDGITVEPRGIWSNSVDWINLRVGDFDGDGDDDIAGRVAQRGAWWVALTDGDNEMTNEFYGFWTTRLPWTDIHVGDFNGDGRADLLGRTSTNGAWWVAVSEGLEFRNERWGVWTTRQQWNDINVGDFNGDGLDDVVGRVAASGAWYVGLSAADFFETTPWGLWSPRSIWNNVVVGDFDDDGKDDLAGQSGSKQWWVANSTGNAFTNRNWGAWLAGAIYVDVLVGDFNGDGREDIIGREQDSGVWVLGISTSFSFSSVEVGQWSTRFPWTNVQTIR